MFELLSSNGLVLLKEKISTKTYIGALTEKGIACMKYGFKIQDPYKSESSIIIGDGNKNIILKDVQNSEDVLLSNLNKSTIDLNKSTPQATFQKRISAIIGRIISFITCSIVIYLLIKIM